MKKNQKPKLNLVPSSKMMDIEDIKKMFVAMTGRQPTEEDIQKAKASMQKYAQK